MKMISRLLYLRYLFFMIFLLFTMFVRCASPDDNEAQIRRHEHKAQDTVSAAADDYFSRITAASNGRLTRFDHLPITIYIPLSEKLNTEYQHALFESLSLWEEASGGKVKFKRVDSPSDADIRLKWRYELMRPNQSGQIGEANLVRMDGGNFHVEIVISLRDFTTMKLLDCDTIKATVLHELGHALGLWGHSPNPGDVMFYSATATKPTECDVATLCKVYATPLDTAFHQDAINALLAELQENSDVSEKARLYYLLGTVYADLNDCDTAIINIQKALEMAPYASEYAARLAVIFDEKGMYAQAIAQYTKALEACPSASLYCRLGLLYLLMEDFEKAIQC